MRQLKSKLSDDGTSTGAGGRKDRFLLGLEAPDAEVLECGWGEASALKEGDKGKEDAAATGCRFTLAYSFGLID